MSHDACIPQRSGTVSECISHRSNEIQHRAVGSISSTAKSNMHTKGTDVEKPPYSCFKNVDFNKLCASSESTADFIKVKLPEYPHNKSHCWAESLCVKSRRLAEKPCPIIPPHFCINVDTHPNLTGHTVFNTILFLHLNELFLLFMTPNAHSSC